MNFTRWCKSGKTKLQLSVFSSVGEINPEHWERVVKNNNIYLSLPYLDALEKGMEGEAVFRYLVLFHGTYGPVAVATLQLLRFIGNDFKHKEELCFVGKTIKDKLIDPSGVKVMVCGNAFACGENGFAYTGDVPAEEIYSALSEAFLHVQKAEKDNFNTSFILLKEFWPGSDGVDEFKVYGFNDFSIDVNMVMEISPDWHNMQDYLSSITAKFRTKANSVFKRSADILVKNLNATDIKRYHTEIESLYTAVYEKASFKFGELNGATFWHLKKNLRNNFVFLGYFLSERLVGFSASFVSDGIADANLVGIDYALNKEYALYQRMLYDFVELSITRKCVELRLGRTAEEIKSCVGAQPVDMKLYLRHKNKVSNRLVKHMVESVSPSKFELRMPFKAQLA